MFCDSSWVLLDVLTHFLHEKEPRILKSISSCSLASRGMEKCAQSVLQLYGGGTWKSGHHFHEPLVSDNQFVRRQGFAGEKFLSPRWLTAVRCRGLGGDEDAGSSLQDVLSPIAMSYG